MGAEIEERLVEVEIFVGRRSVLSVRLDARDVKLPESSAKCFKQLEPETQRGVIRPDMRNIEAETGGRKPAEHSRQISDRAPERLVQIHVLEDCTLPQIDEPVFVSIQIRVEDEVVAQAQRNPRGNP